MANSLLKNNDLTPAWIADRKALLARTERLRHEIAATATRYQALYQDARSDQSRREVQNSWQLYLTRWADEVTELNRKILDLNLQLPSVRLELFQLRLSEELTRAGASETLTSNN